MRIVALLGFLSISGLCYSQSPGFNSKVFPKKADSCHLILFHVVTKEMALSEGQLVEKELQSVNISNSDMKSFMKQISKKSSTKGSRAMTTHHNLVFAFFQNKKTSHQIFISTITGNIEVSNLANNESFYGATSISFGTYLIKLLKTYDMINLIDDVDLKGIR